ncbi:MAG TPA: RluA family pseudouridine synthase [Acidimicrobiales bacterium]|jgi:23S rRNA pseudouridine1911/1915/1917 synthase|nr:RluA family pseudouridine synthase [Acidimicrobiales bacterium]
MIEVIPPALGGERVDRVVSLLTGLSRSRVAALVEEGTVRLDQVPVRARSQRVAAGEILEVPDVAVPPAAQVVPEAEVAFTVVHADEAVIVVDKPAGLVVHPGAGHVEGTLVAGLLARFPELSELAVAGAENRPGIVHRLDKGTSGLMMVARTAAARRSLSAQLAARTAQRRYRALVWGWPDAGEGLIEAPIGRAEADPTRMAVRVGGRDARTRYRVVQRLAAPVPAALLECRLETGRTHQIRVHLAAIGLPVVGDTRYGHRGRWPTDLPRLAPDRLWLHATDLAFDHPLSGERQEFTSELPGDLSRFLSEFSGG